MTVEVKNHDSDDHDGSTLAEDSPLLKSAFIAQDDPEAERKSQRTRTLVIFLIVALIVSVDLPSVLQSSPTVRIIEDIYCKAYYKANDISKFSSGGTIDESLCKIDEVQEELEFLKGWMSFFDHLPGVLPPWWYQYVVEPER